MGFSRDSAMIHRPSGYTTFNDQPPIILSHDSDVDDVDDVDDSDVDNVDDSDVDVDDSAAVVDDDHLPSAMMP